MRFGGEKAEEGGGKSMSYCQGSSIESGAVTRRRSRRVCGSVTARVEAAERSEGIGGEGARTGTG